MSTPTTITMGNDEFILYLRKRYKWGESNDKLGREIWDIIQKLDTKGPRPRKVGNREMLVLWPVLKTKGATLPKNAVKNLDKIAKNKLPESAHQFKFSREILPALYTELDRIGARIEAGRRFPAKTPPESGSRPRSRRSPSQSRGAG